MFKMLILSTQPFHMSEASSAAWAMPVLKFPFLNRRGVQKLLLLRHRHFNSYHDSDNMPEQVLISFNAQSHDMTLTNRSRNPNLTLPPPRVFGTVELLEAILLEVKIYRRTYVGPGCFTTTLELDVRTVLLSQRVNRTFRDIIRGSMKLQQDLWFRPTPRNSSDHPSLELQINPLLFPTAVGFTGPGLTCNFASLQSPDGPRVQRHIAIINDHPDGSISCSQTGSWRDMLVTRDGRGFQLFSQYCDRNFWRIIRRNSVWDKEGIRAGVLADEIVGRVEQERREREERKRIEEAGGQKHDGA